MPNLRRASPDDAEELTRLRALMLEAMGEPVEGAPWRRASVEAFRRRLAQPDVFAAMVVEVDGRVVSSGAGWVEEHLPSPADPSGRRGQVASMSTEPEHRRQGHGAAVLDALLAWFAELGVSRVDLRATADGRRLYEARGFRPLGSPALSRTGLSPR